jgi:hypothetical protein
MRGKDNYMKQKHRAVPSEGENGHIGSKGPDHDGAPDVPLADPEAGFLGQRQRARVSLMVKSDAGFKAEAEITNGGLLSIAALVSSIMLTTTLLVHVAVRDAQQDRWWRR